MASLKRQGINRYIDTWRPEGGCHIRPIADARSSNSNCRIKHHVTSLFVPSCSSWLQNSDPPPCNLKAGLAYGTGDKHPETLCTGAFLKGTWQQQNISTALTRLSIPTVTQHRSHTRSEAKHSTRFPPSTTRATLQLAKLALTDSPSSSWALRGPAPNTFPPTVWQHPNAAVFNVCCSTFGRLDTVSLWFSKKLFYPAILRFCPIFLPFLLGNRFAAGLKLHSYLVI